jgi:GH18 family chitinase
MTRSARESLVLLGLLTSLVACGSGESGSRYGSGGTGSGPTTMVDPNDRPTLRTVVYLPTYHGALANWIRQLQFRNVSYVNLSFAEIDAAGSVRFPDAALPGFVAAAHEAGAKVCVALGGASTINDGGVFATLLQDANRSAFVDKLVKFTADNQLDCLDVDLEGNGVNEFYEAFVTELGAKLNADNRELTAAVAGWFGHKITDKALSSFAFVNVMAYDLYESLQTPMQTSSIEASTKSVDEWAARLPKERVVFGVPFYGMQWPVGGGQPQQVTYADLLKRDPAVETQDELQGNGTIVYLNSRKTIQAKTELAKKYGGIMAWEAGQDASGEDSLLKAIRDAAP